MVSITRQPTFTQDVISSAPLEPSTHQVSPTPSPAASAPKVADASVLPKSINIMGRRYPINSFRRPLSTEQKNYLSAAFDALDKAQVSDRGTYKFVYEAQVSVPARQGQEHLAIELHLDKDGRLVSAALDNKSRCEASFVVEFDSTVKRTTLGAALRLNDARPAIPDTGVYQGGELPWHPNGERYKTMPYIQPGTELSVSLTGLSHAHRQSFDVYDVNTHEFLHRLPLIDSRKRAQATEESKVLVGPGQARLIGGMHYLKRMAPGVKTSNSSPTGYKINGQPCDRHGRLAAEASSAQASSSSAVTGVNTLQSALTKTVRKGVKQYVLEGKAIGPSYRVKPPDQEPTDPVYLSSTYNSAVYLPRNPVAPYIRKLKASSLAAEDTQSKIKTRNKIARLVEKSSRAKHFAVEIFSGQKGDYNKYIARRINGFPLSDMASLNSYVQAGHLDKQVLHGLFDELGRALDWLNEAGYYHNDIQLGNIMYDHEKGALVLIDFELAGKTELYGRSSERPQLEALKEALL